MDSHNLMQVALIPSNLTVIVFILLLFFSSLLLDSINKKPNLVAITPNLLTSIGILGTFWGIFIGLVSFDVHNIDESIPHLLEGMKTAFFSSLCGIASAILFKLIRSILVKVQQEDVGAPEIHKSLEEMRKSIEKSIKRNEQSNEKLIKAIAGDGDSSMSSQLARLRTTVQDGNSDLIKEFKSFAKDMAENNSKALIEALKDVIKDFNNQLTEQFGENFKQLNIAVGKLLEWQDKYRLHVEKMEEKIEHSVQALEHSKEALTSIEESVKILPESTSELKNTLSLLDKGLEEFSKNVESFDKLRSQTNEFIPELEKNMEKMASHVSETIESNLQSISKSTQEQVNLVVDGNNAMKSIVSDIQKESKDYIESHNGMMKNMSNELNKIVTETIENTNKTLETQIKQLDEGMQEHLKSTLEHMGSLLTSLSQKFVDDYTPLTERLKEVVQISKSS